MPYKSHAQRKFFNANRKRLEAEGVDIDEWNEASKGKKLPKKVDKKPSEEVDKEALDQICKTASELFAQRTVKSI